MTVFELVCNCSATSLIFLPSSISLRAFAFSASVNLRRQAESLVQVSALAIPFLGSWLDFCGLENGAVYTEMNASPVSLKVAFGVHLCIHCSVFQPTKIQP